MATHLHHLPTIIIILTTTTHPTATATAATSTAATTTLPNLSPPQQPPYNLSTLLFTLGFHDISAAATTTPNSTTTIFAPTDVSLRSCPYCSLPLLLLEHSVPGLYPFHLLQTLTFGTKIQTLASTRSTRRCLTLTKTNSSTNFVTNSVTSPTLFVGGVEVTRPDLFNDGSFIIHGIQGYVTHLSDHSCQIERMTSLSFPTRRSPVTPGTTSSIQLLSDVMFRLRISQYTVLALLIQQNLDLLSRLSNMTIFAVNDGGVFGDGHTYVSRFRFHVVPNWRLTALELIKLPVGTELPTVAGERLVVTVAGGGGPMKPMRINNVRITSTNVVFNEGVAVHGIAAPFVRVRRTAVGCWPEETDGGVTELSER